MSEKKNDTEYGVSAGTEYGVWCIRGETTENNGVLFHIRTSYHLPPLAPFHAQESMRSQKELKINAIRFPLLVCSEESVAVVLWCVR